MVKCFPADLNPIKWHWDSLEQEIHSTNLRYTIIIIRTKISEECFQHLVKSVPWSGTSKCVPNIVHNLHSKHSQLFFWRDSNDRAHNHILEEVGYQTWMVVHTQDAWLFSAQEVVRHLRQNSLLFVLFLNPQLKESRSLTLTLLCLAHLSLLTVNVF